MLPGKSHSDLSPALRKPPHRAPEATPDAIQLADRVSRLEKQNARLRRDLARLRIYRDMAYRDPLTGLWNRRYFEERLNEELSRAERAGRGRCFSVVVVDLNGFKAVNDRFGHLAGDELLRWVGDFLTRHLRAHDIACRTGGDEFMLLLPDLAATDAGQVIARLRQRLEEANQDRALPVSLSIGSASWPEASASRDQLLTAADAAMYDDKRDQKSRVPQGYQSAA